MTLSSSFTVLSHPVELATLGPESPLPTVQPLLESPYLVGEGIPDDVAAGSRWGQAKNLFPYPMQDAYSRETTATELTAVVLENAHVRASFLPQLGGRLWSLQDKASGKELLHTQDQIQFANLGLRNAWFAGGIEFNIGTRGHSPTTCAPLHSAMIRTPEGPEVLRMWEFDRLREVVFQIDAWLPADSRVVFVAIRIRNPNDATVPMYWWSNAAIPQTPATRVLAPAATAYATDYDGSMTVVAPTEFHGIDATFPARNPHAADFFFDIAPQERRWEVALDDAGDGLALVSSAPLRGRKLFVWGENVGGHHWQQWLTPTGEGAPRHYAEIQSGLAQTQFEHVALPAGDSWQWVEAYGNAALDPVQGTGAWEPAVAHAAERIEALVSESAVAAAVADAARWADLPPAEWLLAGSGWGALERARRAQAGLPWLEESGTPFAPETLTADQGPWFALLEPDAATRSTASTAPEVFAGSASYVRGTDWEELLTAQGVVEADFHLAVMRQARATTADDRVDVVERFRRVLADDRLSAASRALAHRGLGLALLEAAGDTATGEATATVEATATGEATATATVESAVAELARACAIEPDNRWLLIEAMTHSIAAGLPEHALAVVERASATVRALGRVIFLTAQAHARAGAPERAAALLRAGIEVSDLREGENSLADLWHQVCPGEDIPVAYQFSMH